MKCNLCSQESMNYVFTNQDIEQRTALGDFKYYLCKNCNYIGIYPTPNENEISSFYGEGYNVHQPIALKKRILTKRMKDIPLLSCLFENGQTREIKKIIKWKKNNFCVVEYGCGVGQLIATLSDETGVKVTGYDFSSRAVSIAQENNLNVYQAFTAAGIKESRVDFLYALQLIGHIPDVNQFIKDINIKLNIGGIVLLGLPNTRSFGFWLFRNKWKGLDTPRILHQFNPITLKYLLENNGFEILKIKTDTFYTTSFKLKSGYMLNDKHWSSNKFIEIIFRNFFGKLLGVIGVGDNMIVIAKKIK